MTNIIVELNDDREFASWLTFPKTRTLQLDSNYSIAKLGRDAFNQRMYELPLTIDQIRRLMTSEGFVTWKTTPVKIIQTDERDACAVVIRGQAVPSKDFVFPVEINQFTPENRPSSIELTGHVLVGIVINNAVSLWDPNGRPFLVETCLQPLATALTNVSSRPIVVGDSSNHPIYTFGPQQRFQSNGLGFLYLKVKDLAINGFPGKLEEQLLSNLKLDTYVKECFSFWDLAALPNLKMSVWLSGKNVATEATAGSLPVSYKIKPSQWLRLTDSAVGKQLLDDEIWNMTLEAFFDTEEVLEGLNNRSVVPDVKEIDLDDKGKKQYMVTYNRGAFPFHSKYTYASKKKNADDVIAHFTISPEEGWPKNIEKIVAAEATPFDIIMWLADSA